LYFEVICKSKNQTVFYNLDNIILLQLKLDSFALLIGIAPNRPLAQELVNAGAFRVNGLVVSDYNHIMSLNDLLQLDNLLINDVKQLYTVTKWEAVKARSQYLSFIQCM